MKINWGTSIVLAFVGFIVFVLFFVVKTFTQPAYDYDLVSETYYQEELEFQNTINHSKKAKALTEQVVINRKGNLIEVIVPTKTDEVLIGKISFYRPSNDGLDFSKNMNTTENTFVFDEKNLVTGRWDIRISWSYLSDPDEKYYQQESIYY